MGGTVCNIHGGKTPVIARKAEERMRDLVHPALAALERQITKDEFPATKYVLDWAGFKPSEQAPQTSSDAMVRVTVLFDHANEATLELPSGD